MTRETATIPRWFLVAGACCIPGMAAFTLRIVWEETLLTAARGPQMVGFSLMHGALGGVVIPLLLSALGLHLWAAVMLLVIPYQLSRGRRLQRSTRLVLVAALASALPMYVPYGLWRYLVLRVSGPGGHPESHLTFAAAYGETYNVRELLRQGVAVDATTSGGGTALSAACVEGQLATAKYLVGAGADINRTDRILHRTALMNAAEMGHPEVVQYLLEAGADPIPADDHGKTALMIAREKHDARAMSLLEAAEASRGRPTMR